MKTIARSGYVLYQNKNIVAIATMKSKNIKTGNMVQLWILAKALSPCAAAHTGIDTLVCGDCKHRPANNGTCYVTLFQGPGNVYKAYRAGKYPKLSSKNYSAKFAGRAIRFGAYGDPAFIPYRILSRLAAAADGFTGYTHQWQSCSLQYRDLVMASVDNIAEYKLAKSQGWRTFRVSATGTDNTSHEITCPASTGKVQCINCKLCAGNSRKAKDVTIKVHGQGARKFARKFAA